MSESATSPGHCECVRALAHDDWDPFADVELTALLAIDDADRSDRGDDAAEPDWSDPFLSPVYAEVLPTTVLVEHAAGFAPGWQMAHAVAVADRDPAALSPDAQVDHLRSIEKLTSWLAASKARALATFTGEGRTVLPARREEAAAALRLAPRGMPRRVQTARTLTERLPRTEAALRAGTINEQQAKLVAETSWTLDDDDLPRLEDFVLKRAGEQSLREFQSTVSQAAMAIAPAKAEERHQKALRGRAVVFRAKADGIASVTADVDAPVAALIRDRLNAAVRLLPEDDPRLRDEQRADLYVDALLFGLRNEDVPAAQGVAAQVSVHVPVSTLAGSEDAPGWLDGYGPITAQTARDLAHRVGTTWRRLLTDPVTGQILEYGRRRYRPPAALAHLVLARDGKCSFPGCNQPAPYVDIDHVVPFDHTSAGGAAPSDDRIAASDDRLVLPGGRPPGGETSPANLKCLCRTHHLLKTHGDDVHGPFAYTVDSDGSTTWRLTTRHTYTSRPPCRLAPRDARTPEQRMSDALRRMRSERRRKEDLAYCHARDGILADLARASSLGDRTRRRHARKVLRVLIRERRKILAGRKVQDTPVPADAPPPF